METLNTIFSIIQVVLAAAVIVLIALQKSKQSGLSGAISGVADSFLSKNKDRSFDAKLAKATKWVAIAFVVLTLLLNILG